MGYLELGERIFPDFISGILSLVDGYAWIYFSYFSCLVIGWVEYGRGFVDSSIIVIP